VHKTVSVINPLTRAHPSPRIVGFPSARGSVPGFSASSHGTANSGKITTRPGFNNGAPPNSPNRTQAQNRPGQGPNVTRITPSPVNRGTTPTIAPPTVSTSPRPEPRDFIKTANVGNQNRTNLERPAAPQPRAFNPPAPAGGSFSQAPRAQVSNPPSTAQHMGVFRTPPGGGSSSKGFQASSGPSGRSSSSGGSFGARH
jgi:hypothetical protein